MVAHGALAAPPPQSSIPHHHSRRACHTDQVKRVLRRLRNEEHDLDQARGLEISSFGVSWGAAEFTAWCDPERTVAAEVNDEIVAIGHWYPAGHFLGGGRVSGIAVHSVGCRPDQRRRGHTKAIMMEMMREAHGGGIALATLFPGSHAFYAQLGFGTAGSFLTWEAPLEALPVAPGAVEVALRPGTPADWPSMRDTYQRVAATQPGWLDRSTPLWNDWIPERWSQCWCLVALSSRAELSGYVVVRQVHREPRGYDLEVIELVGDNATTRAALWGTVTSAAPLGRLARWHGPLDDPVVATMAEPSRARIVDSWMWSTRVLNTVAAVSERGHNSVAGSAVVEVVDPLELGAGGRWAIECDGASVFVSSTRTRPDLIVPVAQWGSLVSGWTAPTTALQRNTITGDESAAAWLGALWAGPPPWLPQWF